MALDASFLADLEDLSSDEPEEENEDVAMEEEEDKVLFIIPLYPWVRSCMLMIAWFMQLDDVEALNYDDLKAVAKLTSEARYHDVMQVGVSMKPSLVEVCMKALRSPGL